MKKTAVKHAGVCGAPCRVVPCPMLIHKPLNQASPTIHRALSPAISFQDLTASASYPRNSIVAAAMLGSDAFGCYVARILIRTRTAALPDPGPIFQEETDYCFSGGTAT